MDLEVRVRGCGMDSSGSGYVTLAGHCDHGNKAPCSVGSWGNNKILKRN